MLKSDRYQDMNVLLIDIASSLEATEHCIQECERMDTDEKGVAATRNLQAVAALADGLG